jgi:hypothetical protein
MVSITSGGERWIAERKPLFELGYEPFPKQQKFHSSPAKYRLFGGAAGPGKSKALLMEAILQAQEHPGANTLLLRRTFPELEQSLLLYFRRDVPRELYRSFNESKHVVTWWNNSTTRFASSMAVPNEPQSLRRPWGVSLHGRGYESRQHRPCVGEIALD